MIGMCSRECWTAYCCNVLMLLDQLFGMFGLGTSPPPESSDPAPSVIRACCIQGWVSGKAVLIWTICPTFSRTFIFSSSESTRLSTDLVLSNQGVAASTVAALNPGEAPVAPINNRPRVAPSAPNLRMRWLFIGSLLTSSLISFCPSRDGSSESLRLQPKVSALVGSRGYSNSSVESPV